MNAAAKLFIALVIVAAGYFVASLFGPAELAPGVSSWHAAPEHGSEAGEDPALLFGHVRLTPDTTLSEEEKPPSAVLKGTVVSSPSADVGASARTPSVIPEPAPLWLSARAIGTVDPPAESTAQAEHLATIREGWPADENRIVSPAYFADEHLSRHRPLDQPAPLNPPLTAEIAELDDAEGSVRTHIVIDGDSLARLAERYLDDSARWQEIYALNRDQLTDPGLLPIGVELKLPPKLEYATDPSAGDPDAVAQGMVKVDPATISANQPPEAQLLRPQSAKPIYQQYHFTVAD